MAYKTPILLITFNRADHVRAALTEIQKVQPSELYIAQDGARVGNVGDIAKCQEVRAAVKEMVDWPCNLYTHFSEKNLGCGRGPYEAMTWFFKNVEYGIILEDDIVPHPLFFTYMADLLERYKDDERVGLVTAHNLTRDYSKRYSYYFTFCPDGTLGWGTWRRVWQNFDFMIPYDEKQLKEALHYFHLPYLFSQRECANYKKWLSGNRHDCWDYQWDYYLLVNKYLNARANSCLTSHEGDDPDATHTGYSNPGYKMEVNEARFMPITHPRMVRISCSERKRVAMKELKMIIKKLLNKTRK